jgi:predicted MFS family arabinose efflux permease
MPEAVTAAESRDHCPSLRGSGFTRLWSGETISLAGSEIAFMAVSLTAVTTLSASAWEMGVLNAAESAAVLVLGLSAGVWADRHERRGIMLGANLARFALMLAVPVLYASGLLAMPVLYVVAFGVGALTLLFDSAMSAYLPHLVGTTRLTRANSWMESSRSVGTVAGPGVAGLLVQISSPPIALLADAVSYLVSFLTLAGLPKSREPGEPQEPAEKHRTAILTGLRLLWTDHIQRSMVLSAAHFNTFHSMFFAVFTLYAIKTLHFSPFLLGVVSIAGGAAGLVAANVTSRVSALLGQGPALILVYAAPGLSAALVPLAHHAGNKPVAAALVILAEFTWLFAVVINLVISETIKQTLVPNQMLGRITATTRFISWGIQPIGALLGGLIGSWFGLGTVLWAAAVGLLLSPLWIVFSPVRTLVVAEGPGEPA